MKISIRTKVLCLGILLVLLATAGMSVAYYLVAKQAQHRESQQRIRIAFDIVLNDFNKRLKLYKARFDDFLRQNNTLRGAAFAYSQDDSEWGTIRFLFTYFTAVADDLKAFGRVVVADRILFYGVNQRLLAVYQKQGDQETVGSYLVSAEEGNVYLPLDDPLIQSEITFRGNNAAIMQKGKPLPATPLPPGVKATYEGSIPGVTTVILFEEAGKLGTRIIAPIYRRDEKIGLLVGEAFYTQSMMDDYAMLSKTAVNLFVGTQLSLGTLRTQTQLAADALARMAACDALSGGQQAAAITPFTVNRQAFYQGQCALKEGATAIGAVTVSLSQDFEKQELQKILTAVLLISGIGIGAAVVLTLLFSRKAIQAIHNIVNVIGAAAGGDLRQTALVTTHDEIGLLAVQLNRMIAQLRTISGQVQQASAAVSGTADTILRQMENLIGHMEQQSASVDNTTGAIEKIKQFIAVVAQNTEDLLAAAAQILSSIQETRASIEEVTSSTGMLASSLHLISSSVDQVNQVVKQVSENTGQLEGVARQTEIEVQRIEQSLRDVSQNAAQTQQLAKETMDAATTGQQAVDASIQGMTELKTVVANTAQIIQEVNIRGERVSSILDIVDEITEQTSLLALNASIISAQAGSHGRGFAVVAEEIKNLATRTKASTKEIGTLVHELRKKTAEGVKHTAEGITQADQGMVLAQAVQNALNAILDRATHSSQRAADTAQVIGQTAASSQIINASMRRVTEMVSNTRKAIQQQEHDMEQVAAAVENISGMSEQVNRASVEQKHAANQIALSMEDAIEKFNAISTQTEELQHNSDQIAAAMHTIEATTAHILQNASDISSETIKNLVQQADVLQQIVKVFKVS